MPDADQPDADGVGGVRSRIGERKDMHIRSAMLVVCVPAIVCLLPLSAAVSLGERPLSQPSSQGAAAAKPFAEPRRQAGPPVSAVVKKVAEAFQKQNGIVEQISASPESVQLLAGGEKGTVLLRIEHQFSLALCEIRT